MRNNTWFLGALPSVTKLVAATMVVFAVSTAATAGDDLHRAKQSLEQVRKQGEQGDVNAQFALGFMYQEGKPQGVPQDYAEAARWYRLAADQGNTPQCTSLVLCTLTAKGSRRTT
jgi:TPR repeat protein